MHYLLVNHQHRGVLGPRTPQTEQTGLGNVSSAMFQMLSLPAGDANQGFSSLGSSPSSQLQAYKALGDFFFPFLLSVGKGLCLSLLILQDETGQAGLNTSQFEVLLGSPHPGWRLSVPLHLMGILLQRWVAGGSQATRELLFPTLCQHLSPSHAPSITPPGITGRWLLCKHARSMHRVRNQSPASEESLLLIFADRPELSLSSRWNFNIQQDSRELKRKTVSVQPPARAFYFWGNWLVVLCTCIWGSGGSRRSSGLCGGVRVTPWNRIQSPGRKTPSQPPQISISDFRLPLKILPLFRHRIISV